jgi:hypothetical protein
MRKVFIAGLLASTLASAVAAQNADPVRASALISQAQQLNFGRDRQQIARLYEQASAFFSPGDPQATYSLNYAAQFYYSSGHKKRAGRMLERAAQLAAPHVAAHDRRGARAACGDQVRCEAAVATSSDWGSFWSRFKGARVRQ